MKNHVNTPYLRILVLAVQSILLAFTACNDDEILPSVIQFTVSHQMVTEGSEATVTLELDRPAGGNRSLKVNITSNGKYNETFTTSPSGSSGSFVLSILKGQKSAQFNITAIDNNVRDGGKYIIINLSDPDDGLKLGPKSTITITIGDDEGPSHTNFEVNEGQLDETNTQGIVIQIPFSAQAKGTGNITITFTSSNAEYGKTFITRPEASSNSFTLDVAEKSILASFTVFPVNNDVFTDNSTITFSISSVTGVLEKGTILSYTLAILDDELPSIANFESSSGIIHERQAEGIIVNIPFSGPAKGTGKLMVSISSGSAVYGKHYTTSRAAEGNQIKFEVLPGETGLSFTILPLKDFVVTGNFEINFAIAAVEGVIRKGVKLNYSLTIINDDLPAKVNFEESVGEVAENNSSGIVIPIPFTSSAPGGGYIEVSVISPGIVYGAYFTTIPAVVNNLIKLPYDKNQTATSITVLPVNNSNCLSADQSNVIKFKIALIIGGAVEKGENLEYELTIKDDEEVNLATLVESTGSISEANSSGLFVQLNFDKPTSQHSNLSFTTDWWTHQNRLVTDPSFDYDCYWYCYDPAISLPAGTSQTGFKIIPINNSVDGPDYTAIFSVSISSGNGCIQSAPNSKYTLTIVDDD